MKTIKQQSDCEIATCRLDTGEQITFVKDTALELDDATAASLLGMQSFYWDESDKAKANPLLASDFVEVV